MLLPPVSEPYFLIGRGTLLNSIHLSSLKGYAQRSRTTTLETKELCTIKLVQEEWICHWPLSAPFIGSRDEEIAEALNNNPDPLECPAENKNVPAALPASASLYWWPCIPQAVQFFIQACPNYSITKSSLHLPASKFLPLTVPRHTVPIPGHT